MARGRLRIYLGTAPGVGKTYEMLMDGHRRADQTATVDGEPSDEAAERDTLGWVGATSDHVDEDHQPVRGRRDRRA